MRVVFIGPPATGKSSIARRVAARLNMPFTDTDAEVAREHGPIREIFAIYGEPFFRRQEREAVKKALAHDGVVSLGGGAVLDPDTRKDLATTDVVLLTMSRQAAALRIQNDKRPLIKDIGSWDKLVAARRELYESLADTTVDTSVRPLSVLAEEITEWVKERHE